MKTSTKLLIIFFSCISISLMAYNYLLNREYAAGHFVRDYYIQDITTYQKQKTPAFKHIVIDGALRHENPFQSTRPRILIDGDTSRKIDPSRTNEVSIISEYAKLLRTRVKNDTLYLSFYNQLPLSDREFDPLYSIDLVTIHAGNIQSVKTSNANVNVVGRPSASASLTLISSANARCDVSNLKINKLNIAGARDSELNINDSNNIGSLYYSLVDASVMRLFGHPVKEYHAVNVSDAARIEISDKALALQKKLQ